MTELPDECDFCDSVLDEDEDLTPVFVGDPPPPEPVVARADAPQNRMLAGYRIEDEQTTESQILGLRFDHAVALVDAIESHDAFELATYEEAIPSGENVSTFSTASTYPYSVGEIQDTQVVTAVTATPKRRRRSPTLEVCEFCEDSLSEMGESR